MYSALHQTVIALLLTAAIAGCGQMGPLYLPDATPVVDEAPASDEAPAEQASAVDGQVSGAGTATQDAATHGDDEG